MGLQCNEYGEYWTYLSVGVARLIQAAGSYGLQTYRGLDYLMFGSRCCAFNWEFRLTLFYSLVALCAAIVALS